MPCFWLKAINPTRFRETAYSFRPLEISDITPLSKYSSQTIVTRVGLQDEREVSPRVRLISQCWQFVALAIFLGQVPVGLGVVDESLAFGVEFQTAAHSH